jgi:tRNA (mo5U34)-methyltransferase
MTHEEILAELHRLAPWFHRIDLGDGIFTKTESVMGEPVDHPRESWEVIGRCLPDDLRGKSVLDVGCNGGFYCVEAKRRGAGRVLGVDGQRQHVRQALFVRKVLGLDLEFRRFSVYDLKPENVGRFDITLALGLVYHLKHLVFALERLFDVTNELLIIESAIIPPEKTPESFVQPLGSVQQMLHPLFYADNPPDAKEQVFNWFLPSAAALEALLRNTGFEDVSVASIVRDRAVIVCRKSARTASPSVADYVARIAFLDAPERGACRVNAELTFSVRASNIGRATWRAFGNEQTKGVVRLGVHLLQADEAEADWNWGRSGLPRDVAPGESVDLQFVVRAPDEAGDYIIEFDMVAEHVTWFEDFGSGVLRYALSVH